jgi:hypothetical protein
MKKGVAAVLFFVVFGAIVFSACGGDGKKQDVTNTTGLPAGWIAKCVTDQDPLFWYTWHVNTSVRFTTVMYDENDQIVSDYDTSATIWSMEPSSFISDMTGPSTLVTPTSTGTYVLHWEFKNSVMDRNITVVP